MRRPPPLDGPVLPLLSAQTDCPAILSLRTAYLGHSTLEQAMESKALAESFLEDATGECALQIQAHRWVSLARSADFGLNPPQENSAD